MRGSWTHSFAWVLIASGCSMWEPGGVPGKFSLVFTKRAGAQALAVEPSPLVLPGLRTNLRLNPAHEVLCVA